MTDGLPVIFGKKLKAAREAKGLTQNSMAKSMGVSQALLHKIERGTVTVSLKKALQISFILEVPIEELITDSDTTASSDDQITA